MAVRDRKRVLFCFYPSHIKYNHGLALLSGLCKDKGIEVELCLLYTFDQFRKRLKAGHYDYVCFSCTARIDYEKTLPFAGMAQALGFKVLIGGTWAPMIPRGMDNFPPVCRGEGELLPGYILSDGQEDALFRAPMFVKDLNELPLPDYDLFDGIPFSRGYGILEGKKKQLPYFSSRGCPHCCTFCMTRYQLPLVRVRTKVEEDLSGLIECYAPDMVFFGDALLPYYSAAWRDSWGAFRFPFFAYIHASIESELLEWLIDRGLMACSFGIESGDERYRNEVLGKDLSDDQIFRTVKTLNRHGIPFVPFYMIGTPGEKIGIKAKTFEMSDRVGGFPVMWDYEDLGKGVG